MTFGVKVSLVIRVKVIGDKVSLVIRNMLNKNKFGTRTIKKTLNAWRKYKGEPQS